MSIYLDNAQSVCSVRINQNVTDMPHFHSAGITK